MPVAAGSLSAIQSSASICEADQVAEGHWTRGKTFESTGLGFHLEEVVKLTSQKRIVERIGWCDGASDFERDRRHGGYCPRGQNPAASWKETELLEVFVSFPRKGSTLPHQNWTSLLFHTRCV